MQIEEQINQEKLAKIEGLGNDAIKSHFGEWINNDLSELKNFYEKNNYVIIKDFLNADYAKAISGMYPPLDSGKWHVYNNPIEVKYAFDKLPELNSELEKFFYLLSTNVVSSTFSDVTNINLEYDPYLNGAGLHMHPRNGRLGVHLDYEKHPILMKQRRLNVILYMNEEWDDSWNGHSELWNEDGTELVSKFPVRFNTAFIFKTNENSWHGVSEKIKCPEGESRRTIAYYYISDLEDQQSNDCIGNDGTGYRTKACFIKRPTDPDDERMAKLYKIRPLRRITGKDMEEIWPDWNPEDH